MENLTIIYAHNNPFTDAELDSWQKTCQYAGSSEYSKNVTKQLKVLLNNSSGSAVLNSLSEPAARTLPRWPFQNNVSRELSTPRTLPMPKWPFQEQVDTQDIETLPWLAPGEAFETRVWPSDKSSFEAYGYDQDRMGGEWDAGEMSRLGFGKWMNNVLYNGSGRVLEWEDMEDSSKGSNETAGLAAD
ncbi:uncharacterized protein LY89DRAFT_739237 [Mollisia scopiformis]|uniref:Uncharacterized protein n=1 Tax=Mollisia scopiformis TaxID=149040 RepID=A0A194WTL3_MOLSC|nr:uncharacterized protein LY89DRAFT_739237 [Mollisia scopiformis]KUJ11019.1 hypothetical protein LY89DRAFT_739237 [Mollisia scopiformis]